MAVVNNRPPQPTGFNYREFYYPEQANITTGGPESPRGRPRQKSYHTSSQKAEGAAQPLGRRRVVARARARARARALSRGNFFF